MTAGEINGAVAFLVFLGCDKGTIECERAIFVLVTEAAVGEM